LVGLSDGEEVVNVPDQILKEPLLFQSGEACLVVDQNSIWKLELVPELINVLKDESSKERNLIEASHSNSACQLEREEIEKAEFSCIEILLSVDNYEYQREVLKAVKFARLQMPEICADELSRAIQYIRLGGTFRSIYRSYIRAGDLFKFQDITYLLLRICNRRDFSQAFGIAAELKSYGIASDIN
jgi:hypothetical protein